MGDLAIGDVVFDESGAPVNVVGATQPHVDEEGTYALTFDNGHEIVASARHQWPAMLAQRKMRICTTLEIAETLAREDPARIQIAQPWQCDDADLPLDPYVLGAWLGDGIQTEGAICSADHEVIEEIERRGYACTLRPSSAKRTAPTYHVEGLSRALRDMHIAHDKAVPARYLFASIDQRLALLRGLMDTDGHCEAKGRAEFCNTNRDLVDAVRHLVSSLGCRARVLAKPSREKEHKDAYVCRWSNPLDCFELARKRSRLRRPARRRRAWSVRSVRRVADALVRCITVSGESHLFLAGPCGVPTHNCWEYPVRLDHSPAAASIYTFESDMPVPDALGLFASRRADAGGA
jgi:hypothetical protein